MPRRLGPLCALALVSLAAGAHAEQTPQNVVLADLGLHVVGVGYQRMLSPFVAAQLDAELYTPWTQNIDFLGLSGAQSRGDVTGSVLRARVFVYPRRTGAVGPWVSPFAQLGRGTGTRGAEKLSGTLWAAGASAGWAWLVRPSIHVVFGVGAQYHAAVFPGGDAPSFARLYPQLDGSVGWAF